MSLEGKRVRTKNSVVAGSYLIGLSINGTENRKPDVDGVVLNNVMCGGDIATVKHTNGNLAPYTISELIVLS